LLVEHWLLNVFLYYVGSLLPIYHSVCYYVFDWLEVSAYIDATSSVGVLTRLHYPNRLAHLLEDVSVLACFVPLEYFSELSKLFIIDSFLNMECQRKHVIPLLPYSLIVYFHIIVDCFLIAQVKIVLHVVANHHCV
jgi:hypothetical protein